MIRYLLCRNCSFDATIFREFEIREKRMICRNCGIELEFAPTEKDENYFTLEVKSYGEKDNGKRREPSETRT